jgi:integrase
MSAEEQNLFEEYMRGNPCETIFVVALYTGMRIGEIFGLTWDDVDFKNNQIRINKTLVCIQKSKGEKCTFVLQTPKTNSSIRTIPMVSKVAKVLKMHKWQQSTLRMETRNLFRPKAGFENLVFVSESGSPMYETFVNRHLKRIVAKINENENESAAKENRKPVIFEPISPHTLRHSFATRAFEKGMKPKTVQEILGHSSLNMTMDLYTHVTESTKAEEMAVFEKQA